MPQVLKEKHWSDKAREDMTARDWRIFREDHRISYKNAGQNAPMPFRNWDEMPLPAELRRAINDLGHAKPFPIQMASIPFGIRQRDVIGIAETGSGKTAAFVLPMLMYIMNQPVMTEAIAADGPYALILAPTRELAQQIEEETNSLAMHTGPLLVLNTQPRHQSVQLLIMYMPKGSSELCLQFTDTAGVLFAFAQILSLLVLCSVPNRVHCGRCIIRRTDWAAAAGRRNRRRDPGPAG